MGEELKSLKKKNTTLSSQVTKENKKISKLQELIKNINYSNKVKIRRDTKVINQIIENYKKVKSSNEQLTKEKNKINKERKVINSKL